MWIHEFIILLISFSYSNPQTTVTTTKTIPVVKFPADSQQLHSPSLPKYESEDNENVGTDSFNNMHDEVQTLFLDQIESKINDFEDLKVQLAVLDRHLRKHSKGDDDVSSTDHVLTELDGKVIQPYEDGLKTLRNKMIQSGHEISADSVRMVNSAVDKADVFLETGREMVESALDAHLASDEHKNEHIHGDEDGHSEDHMSDYADLISMDTEVSIEDKDMLLEYIDMDINDLKNIKKQKANYENHILDHYHVNHEHVESDELKVAEEVLQEVNLDEISSYEASLQALKVQIMEANGKFKVETIDQISSTMEKAGIYLDASKDRLELVGLLDEEFEEGSESLPVNRNVDDGHFKQSGMPEELKSNFINKPIIKQSDEVKAAFKNAAEESHRFMHDKKLAHNAPDHVEKEVGSAHYETDHVEEKVRSAHHSPDHVEKEASNPVVFFPLNFSVAITIFTITLLVGLLVVSMIKIYKKVKDRSGNLVDDCDGSYPGYGIANKNFKSPQLEGGVKVDDGWTARNWATPRGQQTGRRRR